MKINMEKLRIQGLPYDEKGRRIEPEEMPAERLLMSDADVRGSIDGQVHGSLPVTVAVQGTAGQFANGLRTMCAQCVHFDTFGWNKRRKQLEGSKEGVQVLNGIRWELIQQGLGPGMRVEDFHETPEGEPDLEGCIGVMGYCRALTEHMRGVDPEGVLVHPFGGCPQEVCTPSAPNGFFENLSRDTGRAGNAAYDEVMRNAQGKP